MEKRWELPEPIEQSVKDAHPDMHPALLGLLWRRGIQTKEDMEVFLNPDWDRDTHDASMFNNMEQAVERVFSALQNGEMITVHGDYDADGVCGSSVLIWTLRDICRALGYDESKISHYIPHREKEGYGMSVATVKHLHEHEKTKLVITVDCGISNKEAIDLGKDMGIDTIVCDHHTIPPELPKEAILIHPLIEDEQFPNKYLCGTGVAYKLASGLIQHARKIGADLPEGYDKWLLDLVAIATVTDVMQLKGENRVLEKFGLKVLNKTRRPGLRKLVQITGGKFGELDTTSIGFQIGPRLNAAGRMTHANEALDLMIEEDDLLATEKAMRLHELNKERQNASARMYREAKKIVEKDNSHSLIVVWSEGWSPGIVGLVAGKLVTDFNKPVYAVAKEGDHYVGSGRTPDGFNVTDALHAVSDHLDKFGGHPQACGFSTTGDERFMQAVEGMRAFADEALKEIDLSPKLVLDDEITLEDVDWPLFEQIEKCKPYGQGNPEPIFAVKNVEIIAMQGVGKDGAHLKLSVRSDRGTIRKGIGFRFGKMIEDLSLGDRVDIAFHFSENRWNGSSEIQLMIKDLKKS